MRSFLLLALIALPRAFALSKPDARTFNHGHQSSNFVATAWYAGWHADEFTLEDVPWSKYTHLTYAFASVRSVRA